jgi:hypothetical protein
MRAVALTDCLAHFLPRRDDLFVGCHSPSLMVLLAAMAALFVTGLAATPVEAVCPTAALCRDKPPKGALKHNSGVWTTSCGPNTMQGGHDLICEDIAQCQAAGGFGKFLQAVSGNCRSKTFDGYYGLDGMTFGILDFTSNELPLLFEIYQQQSPDAFHQTFGGLNLPIHDMCLDPEWVCQRNRSGALNCDRDFRAAFERSIRDPDLQKGQLELALRQYMKRIERFRSLGLRTQYGLVALAVVANNLPNRPACKPATWKQQCQTRRGTEAEVVDCMMQKYVEGACRNSAAGARRRAREIEQVFRNHKNELYQEPDVQAIVACSMRWGQGSGAHPPGTRPDNGQ